MIGSIFISNLIVLITSDIQIPVWLFSLVIPLLVTILGITISNIKAGAKEIGVISTSISDIKERLKTIETNFTNHISKN